MTDRPAERNDKINALIESVEKVIVGKRKSIELVIAAMLTGGHILIEDVPGVGKTRLVSAIARSCGDEINRASPKSQSALLEIMEEGQVSIDGNTYPLPKPFMVLATQNPVETYGTYHLPEAQMDRFLMRISMGYPSPKEELEILDRNENSISSSELTPVISCDDICALCDKVKLIRCSENIKQYIIDIVNATRNADYISLGVSPRGSIALYKTAKAYAMISGRAYVIPDDIKFLAPYILAHRIILTPKGKAACGSSEGAVAKILETVNVPVE